MSVKKGDISSIELTMLLTSVVFTKYVFGVTLTRWDCKFATNEAVAYDISGGSSVSALATTSRAQKACVPRWRNYDDEEGIAALQPEKNE